MLIISISELAVKRQGNLNILALTGYLRSRTEPDIVLLRQVYDEVIEIEF
jgi:hypothetical protein